MKPGLKVKVSRIEPDRIPKGREVLESLMGISGIVESSHITVGGVINYVKFNSVGLLSQPFYDRELQEVKS